MHELFSIANNTETNISPLVGSIGWRSNIDELGDQLDFDIAFNDDRYFPLNPVDVGNLIILRNTDEIFRGVVVTENRSGRGAIGYTTFDYGFYLNKSKEIYQFNGVRADQAILKILGDFNIPVGLVMDIKTVVTKIYPSGTVSDIIKDILKMAEDETGIKYRMEFRQGKFYIEKQQDIIIKLKFQLASNLAPDDVTSAISNPSRKRSIEDMRNSIKLVSNDAVVAAVRDESLIKQYGLLQEVSSVDEKDLAQAGNIANTMLKDLGRVFEETSLDMPGDDTARAGRLIEIQEPVTGMSGLYLIKNVAHTVKKGIHAMSLGLGVP